MLSPISQVLLRTLAVLALSPFALCGGDQLYTVNSSDNQIRRVNPVTFSTISSVPMSATGFTVLWANGLATHPQTGELFVLVTVGSTSNPDTNRRLGKVDPTTGVVTILGGTGQQFAGLTFDFTGKLYAVTGDGAATKSTLYSLNTTNATPTMLVSFGSFGTGRDGETIAFDPTTFTLLHLSGNANQVFESVNISNLALTNIPLTGDHISEGLSLTHLAGNNFICVDINDDVFVLNRNGMANMIGTMDHSFLKGIAFTNPPQSGAYYQLYGQGSAASSGFIPALWGGGRPAYGSAIMLGVMNGPGGAAGALSIGFGNAAVQISPSCVVQNLPLSSVTLPFTLSGTLPGKGSAALSLTLPSGVVPVDLYLQGIMIETVPAPALLSANPLQLHIQ